MVTKDDSRRKLAGHMDDIEAKIARADEKLSAAEGDLQAYYQEALVKLKEVKQVANIQLEKLQDSSEEAWEELKDDFDEAVERLRSNLNALMARFGDEPAGDTAVLRERKGETKANIKGMGKTRRTSNRKSTSKSR